MNNNSLKTSNGSYISDTSDVSDSTEVVEMEHVHPGIIIISKNREVPTGRPNEYLLLKQIGSGNNAKIWLTYCINLDKFLALKTQLHEVCDAGIKEISILKRIAAEKGETYCIKILDYFVFQPEDKIKIPCMVFPLYAGSLNMILFRGKHKYGIQSLKTVKEFAKQMCKGLLFLHSKLQVIHADIKPNNILLEGEFIEQTELINLFDKIKYNEMYTSIFDKYGKQSDEFYKELEDESMKFIKKIIEYEAIEYQTEEFDEADSEVSEEESYDEVESETSGNSESDDSDSSTEKIKIKSEKININRNQSVDDLLEFLDYKTVHNLDKELLYEHNKDNFDSDTMYDFTTVLNKAAESTDKNPLIEDKYIDNCKIAIIDFGNSYSFSKRTKDEIQDRHYRSPEVIMDLNYGYSADIWSMGCIIFELLTGFKLFEACDREPTRDIINLYLIEKTLGQIPLKMKKNSPRRKFLFDKNRSYHLKNVEPFTRFSIEERLNKQHLFSQSDAKEIGDFLEFVLNLDHVKRPTAGEVLNHKWLA